MKILLAILALIAVACVQANDTHHPVKITALQRAAKIWGLKNGNRGTGPKITGGHEASPGQIPYQAGVDVDSYAFCGAVIIGPNYILTTATCLYGGHSFNIYVGDVNLKRDASSRDVITTTDAIIHESFDPSGFSFDIALLRLRSPLSFNDNIMSVPCASGSQQYAGISAVVSGWGSSYTGGDLVPILQYADVVTISNDDCRGVYGSVITDSHICSMPVGGTGGCFGDSGGPLTASDGTYPGGRVLIGISAFFDNHGCGHGPDGYTRLTTFTDWIGNHITKK